MVYQIEKRKKERLKKPCKDCSQMFNPTGTFCKYCEKCLTKRRRWR